MISERDISEKFSVVWKQNFPMLTPSFMKVFNETSVELINEKSALTNEEVRYDLVSEAAFNLSQIIVEKGLIIDEYLSSYTNLKKLAIMTARSIWHKTEYSEKDLELTRAEINDVLNICKNIIEFIDITKVKNVNFRPKLKGYGIVPDLEADLEIDDALYEIKTVTRNFKSSDLKQLFIYLALKQVSKGISWKYAGLYNPRKGTFCRFNINTLIYNTTGGNSPNEAFESLLSSLTRDIDIDAKF
jgi:hypothetical protein